MAVPLLFASLPVSAAELLVAAASDLAPAESALAAGFEKTSGHQLRFVFHSSGMLARQIQNGAPYDVYLSANEQYVRELQGSGDLLTDTVHVYALGRLGLWSKKGAVRSLDDLRDPGIRNIAIANPAYAPYGVAAKQLLVKRGLWDTLQPKILFAENVRQTFQYGDSGNADAVITSWTLVRDKGGILLPVAWHSAIQQAGGVLKRSVNASAAREFMKFLLSPAGWEILRGHGLEPPTPSPGINRK